MELLKGESAIVTGSAQGIGRAIAGLFAEEGANVLLTDVDQEAVELAATTIGEKFGGKTAAIKADISSEKDVARVVERCRSLFGRVTLLVNNAGVLVNVPILEMNRETFEDVMRVNVTGTFLMIQAVARLMVEQKKGKIVNISSCSARKADYGQAAYNASKSAILGLTRVTALELGPLGVYCNAVLPGATDTQMTRSTFLTSAQVEKEWIEKTALKRLGRPEDVARAVLFLSCYLSDHITGESLVVSAGELMTQ